MATTAETATAPVVKDEANRPTTASLYVGELGKKKKRKRNKLYY